MRNLAGFLVLLVPDASARFQGRAVDCDGASRGGPRREHEDQMPPKAANQTGQMLGQGRQTALPGPAGGTTTLLVQQWTQLSRHGIVLVEKREHSVGCIEATNNHNDQGLQDEAVGIRFGSSAWPFDWCRGPRKVVNEQNQADKQTCVT
jgi:hypothetical protein